MKKYGLFILVFILFFSQLLAQESENLKFSAQIRPRFILNNKNLSEESEYQTYAEMRTRLGFKFSPTENISGFFQIEDSRTFGEEASTTTSLRNLDIHQAYLELKNVFDLPLDLKVGRMEMYFGTQRLLSYSNWNNVGRSFDGINLSAEICSVCEIKFDAFAFRINESGLPEDSLDENLLGMFAELGLLKNYKLQPFILYSTSHASAYPFNTFYIGGNIIGKIGKFNHTGEFITQFGQSSNGNDQNINAFLAAYNANYNFDLITNPEIGAGVDYLSGDENPLDKTNKTFNTLYGSRHKYLGYMNYFKDIPSDTYGKGIVDIHVSLTINPINDLRLFFEAHNLTSAVYYTTQNGNRTDKFGNEIDFIMKYNYNKYAVFEFGSGIFLPGKILEKKKGDSNGYWSYLMCTVNL